MLYLKLIFANYRKFIINRLFTHSRDAFGSSGMICLPYLNASLIISSIILALQLHNFHRRLQ